MNNESSRSEFLLLAMEAFFENSANMIIVKDARQKYAAVSQAFARSVGFENASDLLWKTDHDVFCHDLAVRHTEEDRRILESGLPVTNENMTYTDKNGKTVHFALSKFPIRDKNGVIIGMYGIGCDTTAKIELEVERERRELSSQMFDDVLEADITENKILRVENSLWAKTLGITENNSFSETVDVIAQKLLKKEYSREFKARYSIDKLASDYKMGIKEFSHVTYLSTNGDFRWIEFSTRLYISRISKTLRLMSFLRDMDDEIRNREQLRMEAETDGLTGLLNRKSVLDQVSECIAEYGSNMKHALLFVDLDHFKQVNDRYGHPYGDKILTEIAEKLRGQFRKSDIVGRVGGDEFLVLLKNVKCRREVENKTRDILNSFPYCYKDKDFELEVTCSIGISMYEGDGKKIEQLYEEADQSMMRAKEHGKNRAVFFGDISL